MPNWHGKKSWAHSNILDKWRIDCWMLNLEKRYYTTTHQRYYTTTHKRYYTTTHQRNHLTIGWESVTYTLRYQGWFALIILCFKYQLPETQFLASLLELRLPDIICWKNFLASCSLSLPFLTMYSNSSPPDTNSIIMKKSVGVLITSYLNNKIYIPAIIIQSCTTCMCKIDMTRP